MKKSNSEQMDEFKNILESLKDDLRLRSTIQSLRDTIRELKASSEVPDLQEQLKDRDAHIEKLRLRNTSLETETQELRQKLNKICEISS